MISIALVFDHRARTKADQEGPVEVRVNIDGVVRYASTGVKCLKKHWQHGLVVDRYDSDELNERLQLIKKNVEAEVNRCIKENEELDFSLMRQNLISVDVSGKNDKFLDWVVDAIDRSTKSEGRKKTMLTVYALLMEFGKIRTWADITVAKIYEFDAWLHTKDVIRTRAQRLGLTPADKLKDTTIGSYHSILSALLYRAYTEEKIKRIDDIPYTKLKGKFRPRENESTEYLTDEEMQKIVDFRAEKPTSQLQRARDLFVIQMYTGLAYIDAINLDLTNYKFVDGRWINNGERIKTGVAFISQLLPPVVEVLERYGWAVPRLAISHYNEQLEELGKSLGITTHLHSHLARHTFATWMLRNEAPAQNVQKMLGHASINQTMRYAKTLAASVHDDFDKVSKLLEK